MDCYIYYKAKEEDAKQIQVCAKQLQDLVIENLSSRNDLTITPPKLQRRPEASNGVHTWMEIYRDVPVQFEQIIRHAAIASGIIDLLIGERRLEYFIDAEA